VTGRYGTLGQVFYISEDFWPLNTTLYVLDFKGNDPRFISYFLKGFNFLAYSDKAAVPGLNRNHLHQAYVQIPSDICEQRAIASILGTLDDKIEVNRRMNRTLEAMAQTLFKSWFVDFDPVIAKREGRKPVGMDDATAAMFPAHFQDSAMGPIPIGWQIKKIENCIVRYGVGAKYEQKTVLPKGKVPVLDQGRSGIIGYHNESPGIEASVDNPIIVFANHTCYMRLVTFSFSAIQNVLPFKGKNLDTIWTFFATDGLQEFLEYKGHWPDLVINKIVVPPEELTQAFGRVARYYIRRIRQNEIQNETLASSRDTLLPKFLSGEIRVSQAEKIVASKV
jgi:type I restriction enzyme, S subunit